MDRIKVIFDRLTLQNWGPFYGKNILDFSTETLKNITYIVGMNSTGKTTIVNALKYILFQNLEGFQENQNIVNRNVFNDENETTEIGLTLTFRVEKKKNHTIQYDISRKWIITKKSSLTVGDLKGHEIFEGKNIALNVSQSITAIEFQKELENIFPEKIITLLYFLDEFAQYRSSRIPLIDVIENLKESNLLMVNQNRDFSEERRIKIRLCEEFQDIFNKLNLTFSNEIDVSITDDWRFIIKDQKMNYFFENSSIPEASLMKTCLYNVLYRMIEIKFPKIIEGHLVFFNYSIKMEDNFEYLLSLMSDSQIILMNTDTMENKIRPIISRKIGKDYEIEMDGNCNSRLIER